MPSPARPIRTPVVALALALSVGVIGIPSSVHATQPPAPQLEQADTLRVELRVNTEDLGTAGDPIREKIVEAATAVLRDRGFDDALDDLDPRIVVVVERTGDEENPGFVIGYSIEKSNEIVPGSARQTDCSLCTRTEVIERIEKDLPPLLDLATEHQAERAVAVSGDGDGDGDGDVGVVDDRKIGPLGFAGIGLAVVGAAGVGVGVGLAVKGFEPIEPLVQQAKDYRTPGNVILSVGGAALIAGVVMVAVDVSKRKKARSQKTGKVEARGLGIAF